MTGKNLFWTRLKRRLGRRPAASASGVCRLLGSLGRRTRYLAVVLCVLCVFSMAATVAAVAFRGEAPGPDPGYVLALIITDGALIFALLAVIARRVLRLASERRRGHVGSYLQSRIAGLFSLVAIIPAVAMMVFSVALFNFGVRSWFNTKVSAAITNSLAVAEAYLQEHKNIIAADVLGVANDLNRHAYLLREDPKSLDRTLSLLAGVRKIPEALLFRYNKEQGLKVMARSNLTMALEFYLDSLSPEELDRAERGETVIFADGEDERVMALLRLENFLDAYIFIGRFVDNTILNYIDLTQGAAHEYMRMEKDVSRVQIQFFVAFVLMALILLLGVIWYGILFATKIARPVSDLVRAAGAIAEGDFSVRVPPSDSYPEIRALTDAFNRMGSTLEEQKRALISAQRHQAWSDVARRIAHEIKNPLTPIRLSAERIDKKLSRQGRGDFGTEKYVATILRNVDQIGAMIEEFTAFAKMRPPTLIIQDCVPIIRQAVQTQEIACARRDVQFRLYVERNLRLYIACDEGKMMQILVNILKNAMEALEEAIENRKGSGAPPMQGIVDVNVFTVENAACIVITDNGEGFPPHMLDSLTEPYVTTKKKGTGLGLAIVKKLAEDHRGKIGFGNRERGGAEVILAFPLAGDAGGQPRKED
jgi:two-component system nitrogen regulation sensor histidine kinase NtrY